MQNDGLSLTNLPPARIPFWKPILFAAFAGGMGWGIRGQYGHETGAMIAGLLVALVLTLLLCPHGNALQVARAVAWGTIAIGFGGSMTYGQTVGLTHDAALVGNWASLRWGMLGLAVKGGLWIGFAGAFLGMGLSGVRYRVREMALVMLGLLALSALGCWTLNEPFDPPGKLLPPIYFSDDWRWKLGLEWKPRREVWGGLLFALAGLVAWTHWWRRDPLAPRLAFWGVLGGAIGFPLGQCLQAYHAWNPEVFRHGIWTTLDPCMNWWNWMETTFGTVMGAALGLGAWLSRRRIFAHREEPVVSLHPTVEWTLLAIHTSLLVTAEFSSVRWVETAYDPGLVMGFIPIVAVVGGRWWPYLLMLPVTALPIAGKTLRQLAYQEHYVGLTAGWFLCVALPVIMTTVTAILFARASDKSREARAFLRPALLLSAGLYYGLNLAFFHFPWPWAKWISRTPNAIAFTVCAAGLALLVLRPGRETSARETQ